MSILENKDKKSLNVPEFISISQIEEHFPAFTPSSIRWWIFRSERGGKTCPFVKRVGRKTVIHTPSLEKWILGNGGKNEK